MIHLDTTFLVDLLPESAREKKGRATTFLGRIADEPLAASVHAVCELQAGAELSGNPEGERKKIETLCRGFEIVYPRPGSRSSARSSSPRWKGQAKESE